MSEKIVQLNEEVIKSQLGQRLRCRLTSFLQSLQTNLRITLDTTVITINKKGMALSEPFLLFYCSLPFSI